MKLKRPLYGGERGGDVLAVQRALNAWASAPSLEVNSVYDRDTEARMKMFQGEQKIKPATGNMGQASLDRMWPFFDAYGRMRYRRYSAPSPLPELGPMTKGGRPFLELSLTHATSGIPLFPAVDLAWGAGVPVLAPESCTVDTKDTSSNPGEALYLLGFSKLRLWVGHLDRDHPLGTKFRRGATLGLTIDQAGTDHGHVGVNAEFYLGKGQQFKYGRNGNGPPYTLGAPSMLSQLEATLL